MAIGNYADLTNLDVANIRRLLDPNFDRSEVNRRAAEQALGGGGFSGARQNRLLESEINQRAALGNSMLAPYLQRQQQQQLQAQAEAATAARQVKDLDAQWERMQFEKQNATEAQLREIASREKENRLDREAAAQRQQFAEQAATQRTVIQDAGATNRLNIQEGGTNYRFGIDQAGQDRRFDAGLERALEIANLNVGLRPTQGAFNTGSAPVSVSGGIQPQSALQAIQGGGQSGGGQPNSATMQATWNALGGIGSGGTTNKSPNLLNPNASIGQTQWGNSFSGSGSDAGYSTSGRASSGLGPTPSNNFVDSNDPVNYDWAQLGNYGVPNNQTYSGTGDGIVSWGGVDSQINDPTNWSYDTWNGSMNA